jgi:hypothetical protein
LLACEPMRITKRFAGFESLGKVRVQATHQTLEFLVTVCFSVSVHITRVSSEGVQAPS